MFAIRLSAIAVAIALLFSMPAVQAASAKAQADEIVLAAMDLEAKGDLDGAIAKYREALKLVPNNKSFKELAANALNTASIAKHNANDDATAIAYLEEALQLVPNFKQAKDNLAAIKSGKLNQEGIALLKAGDYAGAAAKFSEILSLSPDNTAAKINRDVAESQLALKNGDPATAVAKLQEAISLDPSRQFLKDKLAEAQAAADAKAAKDAEEAKKKK